MTIQLLDNRKFIQDLSNVLETLDPNSVKELDKSFNKRIEFVPRGLRSTIKKSDFFKRFIILLEIIKTGKEKAIYCQVEYIFLILVKRCKEKRRIRKLH